MSTPDLKDLQILRALHELNSVSQAAEAVGLSQPSISIRLARLRTHFHDPLVVRTRSGMQPTPRLDSLMPAVRQALELLQGSAPGAQPFDPAASTRVFRIAMTNVGQIVVLPRLLTRLKTEAPRLQIEVKELDTRTPRMLEIGEVDLAMGFTLQIQAGFYQQTLFNEHYVGLVAKRHPVIGRTLTRERFAAASHVVVDTHGTGHWLLDRAIEESGIERHVALRVPSFLALSGIVASTDLIALAPVHLASIMAQQEGVRLLDVPFDLPSYAVKQYWHERFHRDPGNVWLRSTMSQIFAG